MQQLAVLRIRKMGLNAYPVSNGREVLEAIEKNDYALILMDCQMPEMDGFEATIAIRRNETKTGGHTPIIAMTASAMVGDREHCITSGMDDYLSKPVSQEQLTEVLRRWLPKRLQRSKTRAEVVAPPDQIALVEPEGDRCAKPKGGRQKERNREQSAKPLYKRRSDPTAETTEKCGESTIERTADCIDKRLPHATNGEQIDVASELEERLCDLDLSQLEELYGKGDMHTLLESFVDESMQLAKSVAFFCKERDGQQLAVQVHQLKGLASVMTAERLSRACANGKRRLKSMHGRKLKSFSPLWRRS